LLDKGDLRAVTNLHNVGEAILYCDNQDIEFKSYYLDDNDIEELIKHKYYKPALPNNDSNDNNKVVKLNKITKVKTTENENKLVKLI